MKLGEFIRKRRTELGMPQKELADKLGISPQYMSDIEKGNRNPTDYRFIEQLSEALSKNEDCICFMAGILPRDIAEMDVSLDTMAWAFTTMRQNLKQ